MAHFAKLDENNTVINVIKIDNADIDANGGDWSIEAEQWVNNKFKGTFKQTSYNSSNGKYRVATVTETDNNGIPTARTFQELENDTRCKRWNYASINGKYDPVNDVFYSASAYPSWILNTYYWRYEAPVEYPSVLIYGENSPYFINWDEDNLRWLGFDNLNNEFVWDPISSSWSATGN